MSDIFIINILIFFSFLLVISYQQIIYNPVISDKKFNLINYIIIPENNTRVTLPSGIAQIKNDFIHFIHESYIFANYIFLCKDESNNYFFLFNDRFFEFKLPTKNEIEKFTFTKNLNENIKYLGYITCLTSLDISLLTLNNLYFPNRNEIIIYGQLENQICFYYLSIDTCITVSMENFDELISCILIKGGTYVCIYTIDNDLKISSFI